MSRVILPAGLLPQKSSRCWDDKYHQSLGTGLSRGGFFGENPFSRVSSWVKDSGDAQGKVLNTTPKTCNGSGLKAFAGNAKRQRRPLGDWLHPPALRAPQHTLTGRYMGQALSSFSGPRPSSGSSVEEISPPVKMSVSTSLNFPAPGQIRQEQPHSRIAVAARSSFILTAMLSAGAGADKGSVEAGAGQGQPGLSRC